MGKSRNIPTAATVSAILSIPVSDTSTESSTDVMANAPDEASLPNLCRGPAAVAHIANAPTNVIGSPAITRPSPRAIAGIAATKPFWAATHKVNTAASMQPIRMPSTVNEPKDAENSVKAHKSPVSSL